MLIIILLSIVASSIFLISLVSITVNIVLFVVTKMAIFKISLIISVIIITLVTIFNFVFLCGAIKSHNEEHNKIVYAKSGKFVYWGSKDKDADRSYFEMDGVKYNKFDRDTLDVNLGEGKRGDPVANINDNPATVTFFTKIWTFWTVGTTHNQHSVWTLYHVTTDKGFEYYYINDFGNFMAEEKLNFINGSE